MQTKASIRAATSGAICAVIFATFAIGASGTAFAACGVSSGSAGAGVHVSTGAGGIHSGVTGSTHGTSSSSCSTMTNATHLRGSALGAGIAGAHVYTHTAIGGTQHNFQTNHNNNSHTFTRNNKTVGKPKP